MNGVEIREATAGDAAAIDAVLRAAFEGTGEATLVEALRREGDCVLELVAVDAGAVIGEILFSRLAVMSDEGSFDAVALAPLAVAPTRQGKGIGRLLVERAHALLRERGYRLSVVLGDPAYYGHFGYEHARAEAFESEYQGDFLQALAWGDAPTTGRLRYAPAFAGL